jgi:hypothetical protein
MDDNVIHLANHRIEMVYEHHCGGRWFFIHKDGSVECVNCNEEVGKVAWTNMD